MGADEQARHVDLVLPILSVHLAELTRISHPFLPSSHLCPPLLISLTFCNGCFALFILLSNIAFTTPSLQMVPTQCHLQLCSLTETWFQGHRLLPSSLQRAI